MSRLEVKNSTYQLGVGGYPSIEHYGAGFIIAYLSNLKIYLVKTNEFYSIIGSVYALNDYSN